MADPAPRIRFQSDEWERVQRAAEVADFDDPEEFVHGGALRFVDETIDGDGQLECPHDDCDRTFATIRQRRGHLGNVHADIFPEGDFWCGYCGYGPSKHRGINAHHSQRHSEQGDPVRLDHKPDQEELLAPDDIPDHQDPMLLERLYHEHDGCITDMCRAHDFDVTVGRVRHYLIEFDIHEPTPQGPADEDGPRYRDPEWLKEQYEAADGNISEMHSRIDVDVPYRTLQKNLKRFGIHDPTDPLGKRHGKGGSKPSTEAEPEPKPDDEDRDDGTKQLEGFDHTDPEDLQKAFDENDTLRTAAEEFPQVTYATVRQRMIDHGIHEPDTYDTGSEDTPPTEPDPDSDATEDTEPDSDATEDPDPDSEPTTVSVDQTRDPLGVEDPAAVDSFHDLDTPGWLDEASFYQAIDMADDIEELADVLGWAEYDLLKRMVELLGVGEDLDDYQPEHGQGVVA